MRRWFPPGGVVMLFLVAWTFGFAQIPEGVPEDARVSWDRGLDAFRQGDWDAAIRNLVVVQEAAPTVPAIIYNLALSYDFSAFNELLAMGWLNTYIAAAPDAPNVLQAEVRIGDLDSAALGRLAGLFQAAKRATESQADSGDPSDRMTAYGRIARAQARSQVMAPQALITAGEIPGLCVRCAPGQPEQERTRVLQGILEVQIAARDLEDAFNTAAAISADEGARDEAFRDVALALARRGSAERAEAALSQIADSGRRDAARGETDVTAVSVGGEAARAADLSELDGWLGFMREYGPSMEEVSGVFPNGAGETEALAVVDTLIETASAFGQELARLREMRNSP
jgi:hypothetical protein